MIGLDLGGGRNEGEGGRLMATELVFRADAYAKSANARVVAVDERGIELDRTIFYPAGGGQQGDTGALLRASGERIAIVDTRKGDTMDSVRHIAAPGAPPLATGETLSLELDWPRRYALMRLHTALHVMSCVVVAPVTGGNIAPDKARLDFDIDMSLLDAQKIERETNALIARGVETETVWITDEELDARPELVKTMSVQPPRGSGRVRLLKIPGIDLQPCGGTHVRNIAEIGGIRVLKIRSEGRCNRRVEIALAV
jgi:misacylated tRNA(Ala) deacylase